MTSHAPMIAALRAEMKTRGLDGLIVPRFDAHQGEYVAPHDKRLGWLTGFTGSAGMAILTHDTVAIFVDGRYTVQVQKQCAEAGFEHHHFFDDPADIWVETHIGKGQVLGFDAMLLPPSWFKRFALGAALAGAELRPLDDNPLDAVWKDQPRPPMGAITSFPLQHAGKSTAQKRGDLWSQMQAAGASHYVETQPDNIAWFLNVRGADVDYNPMPQSFLLVAQDGATTWFVTANKFADSLLDDMADGIEILPMAALIPTLEARLNDTSSLLVDPDFSPAAVSIAAKKSGAKTIEARALLTMSKALKNPTELNGMRDCHIRDGIALTEFSAWLLSTVPARAKAGMPLTEREAEAKMLEFRAAQPGFITPSFNSISAASGNAAMCHYATTDVQNAQILPENPYLLDSGGQYDTGTTDATRSFSFGHTPKGYTRAYTAVLKAFIALATSRFPKGTQGHHIDAICRRPLWDLGLDYDHGTGHGVGHCLSVHEQPQRIAKVYNPVDLRPGMVLSIEPGHYVANLYGIRIENLFEIIHADDGFMEFANMTYAPIQTDMLELHSMSAKERGWLNNYHAKVEKVLEGRLSADAEIWLKKACLPV